MNHQEYNGWYNYETWVTALWLQNDQGSCSYWEEMTNEVESVYDLSQMIEDEIKENDPTNDQASLYSDLMSAAISEINFNEIAHHFWSDYRDPNTEKISDIVDEMIVLYAQEKDNPDWKTEEGYTRIFWSQTWIPELFDDIVEKLEEESELWIETGVDPTDIFVCGSEYEKREAL